MTKNNGEPSAASAGSVTHPPSTPQVSHTLAEMYHALVVAHAEHARLREAIVRLSEQDATLTDAERNDLAIAADAYSDNDDDPDCERIAATLRGLLERLK